MCRDSDFAFLPEVGEVRRVCCCELFVNEKLLVADFEFDGVAGDQGSGRELEALGI